MTTVQHTGNQVLWLPHPNARKWHKWALTDPNSAAYRAPIIRSILDGTHEPNENSPLWTVMVAWMHHDGPRLDRNSFPSYVIDIRYINQAIGLTPLKACHDTLQYQALFNALERGEFLKSDDPGSESRSPASESQRRCVARTLATICGWAQETSWWPHQHEMFGHATSRRKIRRSAFEKGRDADIAAGRVPERIRWDTCPTFEATLIFSRTLTDVAVDRWGKKAAYLGSFPVTQYLTGARYGEGLAHRPTEFTLAGPEPRIWIPAQIDKNINYVNGCPTLKTPKNGKERTAYIWESMVEVLEPIVADAEEHGRPHLYMSPVPDLKTFPRQFIEVYALAAEVADYEYTSHWHRHAYASYNLASTAEGGFGRSLKTVAEWLGHAKTDLTDKRYWHPSGLAEGWSSHKPGERR
jgi:hypothetical protein